MAPQPGVLPGAQKTARGLRPACLRGIRPSGPTSRGWPSSAGASRKLHKRFMTLEPGRTADERPLHHCLEGQIFLQGIKRFFGEGGPGTRRPGPELRMCVPGGWDSQPVLHRGPAPSLSDLRPTSALGTFAKVLSNRSSVSAADSCVCAGWGSVLPPEDRPL